MTSQVQIDVLEERNLAVLRLANEGRKNAISSAMWNEIGSFAKRVSTDARVRVVLIRSGSDFFSAGADISDFAESRSGKDNASSYDDLVEATCRQVEAIAQPTICLIQGLCIGAGASLAASCDVRIATEHAAFLVPAARLGLGYDIRGIERFRRVFGHSATTALLFTANKLMASVAHSCGAVHLLAPAASAEMEAFAVVERIANNAPLTLRAAKLALHALGSGDSDLRLRALEAAAQADSSDDYREGRAAFAEKRVPRFKGA